MKYIVKLLLLLAALCVAACTRVSAEDRPTVRIGMVAPLTGGMAEVGAAFRDAARLAIDDLPEQRAYNYEMVFEDDALSSSKAAIAANKLLFVDKVDAIISTWSYGGTVVAPLAERAKVIHFGVAWDPAVAKGDYNFIHLTPPREFLAKIFDAFQKLGYHKIASFGVTESGSEFALDELERLGAPRGMQVVDRNIFMFTDTDMRPALLKAAQHHPDVIFVNLPAPQIDLFMKQVGELKLKTPVVAMTGFDVANDLAPLEGLWYVSDSFTPEKFTDHFSARYHHTQLYGTGNYYDAVKLIAYLFEHAAGTKKPASAQLLPQMKDLSGFDSIFGKLSIDADGIITYPARYVRFVNGKRTPITLDDIK